MRVIGLTGGIGSGKSTVAGFLKDLGAHIIDADKVGHKAYEPQSPGWEAVLNEFGNDLLLDDNSIDRKKLGRLVFDNPNALERLNKAIHPIIHQMVKKEIGSLRETGAKVVVLEAALLFEANWQGLADEVWTTTVPEEIAFHRIINRNALNADQVRARMNSQMSPDEKVRLAQVSINTNKPLEDVHQKVVSLWNQRVMIHGGRE